MTSRRTLPGAPAGAGRLPLADAAWLAPLLNADTMRRALMRDPAPVDDLVVTHVRYRPGASCTIAYAARMADGSEDVSLYTRALAPGRGRPPFADAGAGPAPAGRILPRPLTIAEGRVVIREFPQDATLPELAIVAQPGRLTALVADAVAAGQAAGSVTGTFARLRYKAEHRLILRADLRWRDLSGAARDRTCQVRFEYGVDRTARQRTRDVLAAFLPADGYLQAPGAEVAVPAAGCSVVDWRPGRDMGRDLLRGRPGAVARAARTLATVSSLPADAFDHLPLRTAADALDEIAAQIAPLGDHPPTPDMAGRFAGILDRLGRILPDDVRGLVHGDFHQGQVLVDGEQASLLDWDRAHLGDPARDRGRFLAQVHLLDVRGRAGAAGLIEPFRAALAEAGAEAVDGRRETFWTVTALADLALRELRRLRPDWEERTTALLVRCNALLDQEGTP